MKVHTLISVLALGLCCSLITGCFVWDTGNSDLNKYFEEMKNEEKPGKPIAAGDSLETVVERIGMPETTVSHGKYLLASWKYSRGGHLLLGLIGGSDTDNLFILFDEEGKVIFAKKTKGGGRSFSVLMPYTYVEVQVPQR